MSVETILPLFPLIPILGIILHLFITYVLKREPSRIILAGTLALQTAAAAGIIFFFVREGGMSTTIAVSRWNFSIQLAVSRERIYLLSALVIPLAFALLKTVSASPGGAEAGNPLPASIFLFYIAACSGIFLTADIFNFFVFYELMIMAAYILISVEGKYFASIKYMLVGGVSSCFFLAGIIFVYASGLPFSFSAVADLSSLPIQNSIFIILFFATAFSIKSALFPVSSWLTTCHSATNGTISAFLSSYTVISGFFGLYYLVLIPAGSISFAMPFTVLKIISLITMGISALFIFFESELKRCIAGSTVFSAGFIGLLFSIEAYEAAWLYISVHALYKSLLFHQAEAIYKKSFFLSGKRGTFIIGAVLLLFAGGIIPAIPHFIKSHAGLSGPAILSILYGSVFLMLAGFVKFEIKLISEKRTGKSRRSGGSLGMLIIAIPIVIALYVLFFLQYPTNIRTLFSGKIVTFVLEWGIVALAIIWGKLIYPRIAVVSNIDTRFVFRNLNIELFFIFLLFGLWLTLLLFA